jgi:hypothetical protein
LRLTSLCRNHPLETLETPLTPDAIKKATVKILQVTYPSPIEESNPENDNIDVHVELDNGRVYSFLVATPNNIFWCMENEGNDYFFGWPPPIFVKLLTPDNIERALHALLSEDKKWLELYGVLQTSGIEEP